MSLQPDKDTQSLLKGLLAGAIGGIVATAAKSVAEKVYPPRVHGEPEPPEVAAEKLPEDQTLRERTSEGATHILYGVVAERVRSLVRGMLD